MSRPVSGRGEFRTTTSVPAKLTKLDESVKTIRCSVIENRVIFEGDIIVGEMDDGDEPAMEGLAISGPAFRWPNATVPFVINATLPNPARVTDAIAHWEANTNLRFKAKAAGDVDFVEFVPGSGCSSQVGKRGGRQIITLGLSCTKGNTIHEIGHTVGLWHEQSREDRDDFIEVVFSNIDPDFVHNFNQHITDGDDIGDYDYGSIMHYPAQAFAIDDTKPTLVTPNGEDIGQRIELSAGDIAAANELYPTPPV